MVHRGIATLAIALTICFLLLTHFDQQFFFLHFYESLIYLAILLMLFYFEDRWAYMLGIVGPIGWLALVFIAGGTGDFLRQLGHVLHGHAPEDAAPFIGGLISVLSIAMVCVCLYRWRREFTGLHKGLSTFAVTLIVTAAYYALLVFWFWRAI